jgi:ABC-type multidrug transport system fused ATPase/permease subunit
MRRRTTLIVSHRVSAVRDADRILVMDAGAVVDQGTHDELLGHGGLYAALVREQQLEEEIEAS